MGKAPKEHSLVVLNEMTDILNLLDSKYPIRNVPDYGRIVNYAIQSDEPIHRWFRYREGYSTKLLETLLKDIPKGKLVVDPFCGSGTTLLVAGQQKYPSIGLDVNPLSVFVTKTKTKQYSSGFKYKFPSIYNEIRALTPSDNCSPKPSLNIIDNIFHPEILHALLIIKNFINRKIDFEERDFLFLAWLSILEEVSNVYKEGNGLKYRNRKRTPNGYENIPIDIWQQKFFPDNKFDYILSVYLNRVTEMFKDIPFDSSRLVSEAYIGDALNLDDFVQSNSAGLIAFSPPYCNNFNYFKAYKVELWMGDFVNNYDDVKQITQSSLRSHVETQLFKESDSSNWYPEEIDSLINLIDTNTLWNPKIINSIKGYFYDMHNTLEKIYESLEPNGKCAIVVGNSAYGSILIPTDSLLAETAREVGLEVESFSVARHLTTSSQQKQALETLKKHLRESVLILKKPKSNGHRTCVENGGIKYRHVFEFPKYPHASPSTIYIIKNKSLTDSTHIIHKYPGKFIPHVPRWAIEKYLGGGQKRKVIFDPFCGSGTTLVEGLLSGHNVYGSDIDPLARLISKVKVTPIEGQVLQNAIDISLKKVSSFKGSKFLPSIDTLEHWFSSQTISELGMIRSVIEEWKNKNTDIYDFLIIAFSSIIRKVSKADNQSLKTYVSGTFKKIPVQVMPLFEATLKEYAARISQLSSIISQGCSASVFEMDARNLATQWDNNNLQKVDLVVTSPPYIKSVDYIYNQMAEYFWIGDLFGLENQKKQNTAKTKYIGTEKVVLEDYNNIKLLGIDNIDSIIELIYAKNHKHAYICYKYFSDMQTHFQQMNKILKTGAIYVSVIGNSVVSDVEISTSGLIREIAIKEGYNYLTQFNYEIRNRYMRFPRQGRGGIVNIDRVVALSKQ